MSSIPTDLIVEIFSRLPTKSIERFRCVSKQLGFILSRQCFTESFFTRFSAHPRLLFAVERFQKKEWHFFTSPQLRNPYEKSSYMAVTADYHIKFPQGMKPDFCRYASGLIYFRLIRDTAELGISNDAVHVICNPSTGQRAFLPKLITDIHTASLLGFDPIGKIFKVLLNYSFGGHKILTLGIGKTWRNIQCTLKHSPLSEEGICINGVLYYLASHFGHRVIVCFDVRSEKFKFIDGGLVPCFRLRRLINYKGKLGVVSWNDVDAELCTWVLKDVEKQEWSEYVYTLPENIIFNPRLFTVAGVTATGEIVFSMNRPFQPFLVFYFNPERNSILQRVEIQGCGTNLGFLSHRVVTYMDNVEGLSVFDDAMYLKSSISAPSVSKKRERGDHWSKKERRRGRHNETQYR